MTTSATRSPLYSPAVPQPPRASRYIRFNGKEIVRGVGFLRGRKLTCPAGHHVNRRSRALEDELLYCDALPGPRDQGAKSCSTLSGFGIYVLVFPARGDHKRTFAADCSIAEFAEIERLNLDPDGILEYFGATFAR